MKNKTPFLENPTFEKVLSEGKKTQGVYISLNNGEFVRCECKKDGVKANISFDLYTSSCNHDLTQVAQEHLHNEHQAYIKKHFFAARYTGTIHNMFFGTDIYFDVLYGDAEEWFQKILATLN